MSNSLLWHQRTATSDDSNFIYATWLQGLYHGNSFYRQIDKESYYRNYRRVLDSILAKSKITIVCLNEDPTVILGFVVYDREVLHWVFVKPVWRTNGIAKSLIPQGITKVTHLTTAGKAAKPKKWAFDPFLI